MKTRETLEAVKVKHKRDVAWLSGELDIARATAATERARGDYAAGELENARAMAEAAVAENAQLRADLDRLYRSKSWRITAPLRRLMASLSGQG